MDPLRPRSARRSAPLRSASCPVPTTRSQRSTQVVLRRPGRGNAAPRPAGCIVRRHDGWQLRAGTLSAVLPDGVGSSRLIGLLERPFEDVAAVDLMGGAPTTVRQEVADLGALRAYHERLGRLRAELDEAERDGDVGRIEQATWEREQLLEHVRTATSVRGRRRAFTDDQERARIAVRKSITRVLDAMAEQSPVFAAAMEASLRTGTWCSYRPFGALPDRWQRGQQIWDGGDAA